MLLSLWIGLLCHPLVFLHAATFHPTDGDTLNTTHVLFRWMQQPEAQVYRLQVALFDSGQVDDPFQTGTIADVLDATLMVLLTEDFEWGCSYAWRVGSIGPGLDSTVWSPTHIFHTAVLPPDFPIFVATMYDSSRYAPGLTVFDVLSASTALGVDQEGRVVWFISVDSEVAQLLLLTNLLSNGNFLAAVYTSPSGSAYEITLDNRIVWEAPAGQESSVHHDIIPMPNGNYMAITLMEKNGPIPEGPWNELFNAEGTDSIPWRGDVIIEWDPDGNEVWRWSSFEHFSMEDYDSTTFTIALPRGFHDWTHSNAVYYDPVDQAVYLSSRQLSRITKIDYLTGEIVWMMGRAMPSGQVKTGNDLDFSWQHSIKVLDNRNLMLFDNGNLSTPQLSRALEISITETDSFPMAEIVWEYVLPESLYTKQNGEADRLSNGNTLIATGPQRRILEVDADSSLIWELQMTPLSDVQYYIFRSDRIPGLYPQAFCVLIPDFNIVDSLPAISLETGPAEIEINLYNKGWLDETYHYSLNDEAGVFRRSGSQTIAAGNSARIIFTGTVGAEAGPNAVRLVVTPSQAPALADTIDFTILPITLATGGTNSVIPAMYALHSAYPNPFNPMATIRYDLPITGEVSLIVYDILGREVVRLVDGYKEQGYHQVQWDGSGFPSGLYIARLNTPKYRKSIKLVLLK
jgi:hypothetical protein